MKYLPPLLILCFSTVLTVASSKASAFSLSDIRQINNNTSRVLIANNSTDRDYSQSVELFNSGKFTESIASFGRIISNASSSRQLRNKALIGRSQAFLIINQPALAIVDLKKTVYKSNEKKLIGNRELILGVAFIQVKQYSLAVKHLSEAISYLPNDPSVLANRSVAYQALNDYNSAIKDLQRALKIKPTQSFVFNLAVLEKERKNFSQCYYLLSQLVNQKASHADIYLQRGLCLKALNQHKEALEDFLRSSTIDPSKAEAIENVGLMLSIMGKNSTALKYLEAASTLYLQQGNIEAFESISALIVKINPN